MKRCVSRRRGVRGGDWENEQIGYIVGGSGVRGRSRVRGRGSRSSRGRSGVDLGNLSGGYGVRGRRRVG